MGNKNSNIPVKVLLSYFILVALVVSVGWFLYSENVVYTKIENKIASEHQKYLKVSNLFSSVYKTEGLARKAIQTNANVDFKNYIKHTDSLLVRIDSLKKIISSDYQVKLLDSVTILLNDKTQNINKLRIIKNKNIDDSSVTNAIDEITQLEFSLRKLQIEDFTKTPNKLGSYQRNVLQRYVDYLNQNIPDDSSNTLTKKASDSILSASKQILSNVKRANQKKKESLQIEENNLLTNEILISDQLRKVLHLIDREVLSFSVKNNTEKEKSLKKINQIVTYAAIAGLLLTLFFSVLITSDFSKTQSYKKQLEVANEKTQNLLHSREQLISTVSHDLKTPLSTIIGYTELLGNSELNKKQHYFTNTIKNSSQYISRLVQDLLDLSQLEAGKIVIKNTPFLLPEILSEVAHNIQGVHTEKPIELIITSNPKLDTPIIGDVFRLKQILTNIVGNAFKFTAEGFIKINATLSINEQFVFITIEDSGIGIEKESQKLVFEEFTQANSTIERKFGGTGLGLAISKKIASLLGGDLYLKHSSEKGSCFEMQLPLLFDTTPQKPEKNHSIIPLQPRERTIVVVDDDHDLLQLTTEVLKQHYKVYPFSEAKKALENLSSIAADLVITDIQMPILDGFSLAKKIRSQEKTDTQLPIIAVTGRTDLNSDFYNQAGFTTVIQKPFSPSFLIQTIEAVFNHIEIPQASNTSSTTAKTKPLFSLDTLSEFLNHDTKAVQSFIHSFVKNTNENLIHLKEKIKENEASGIKAIAHKMAPMFKQIEAIKIASLLTDLENKNYSATELHALFEQLEKNIQELFTAFKNQIN